MQNIKVVLYILWRLCHRILFLSKEVSKVMNLNDFFCQGFIDNQTVDETA